jgi:hypothetical protein
LTFTACAPEAVARTGAVEDSEMPSKQTPTTKVANANDSFASPLRRNLFEDRDWIPVNPAATE